MFCTPRKFAWLFIAASCISMIATPALADLAVGGGGAAINVKNNVTVSPGVYASPLPSLAPGAISGLLVDQNGLLVASPYTNTQVGTGIYDPNPSPLQDQQVSQVQVDAFKRQVMVFPAPQPISIEQQSTVIDRSGTVLTASLGQVVAPENANRHGYMVVNQGTHTMWINDLGNIASGGGSDIPVAAGTTFVTAPLYAPKGAITLYDTTAAEVFAAREW